MVLPKVNACLTFFNLILGMERVNLLNNPGFLFCVSGEGEGKGESGRVTDVEELDDAVAVNGCFAGMRSGWGVGLGLRNGVGVSFFGELGL